MPRFVNSLFLISEEGFPENAQGKEDNMSYWSDWWEVMKLLIRKILKEWFGIENRHR